MKNRKIILMVAGIWIAIDQISKAFIHKFLPLYKEITIIPNFFFLNHQKNTGAAFSIFENKTLFLIILSVLFLLGMNYFIKKEEKNLTMASNLALGIIMGGIYGNLIDRVLQQGVTDFLSFKFFHYYFPIFNIADIGITVGTICLLIMVWKPKKKEQSEDE